MLESYLRYHMERTQKIVLPHVGVGVDVGVGRNETYVVSFPRVLKLVACPIDGCLERAKTRETQRTIHLSELEDKGGNYTGGTGNATYI